MTKVVKSDQEWREILSEDEYYITRQKGTEPAFSGKAFDISKDGVFKCRCCGAELFERTSKYESGCGWPSFFKGISNDAIKTEQDTSHGMIRTCLLYTSPSPRDGLLSRMPSSA